MARAVTLASLIWLLLLISSGLSAQDVDLVRQTAEEAERKSKGCKTCHGGIEPMHSDPVVKLGCIDCHLGDASATTEDAAHVKPRYPDEWKSSANPQRSYTLLNKEDPAFIQFVNPGDLRVAEKACGTVGCHNSSRDPIVTNVKKSMMTTSALLWGGAAYNNGIVSTKNYIFGESYSTDGIPQQINTVPAPTEEELKKGILPFVVPLPRWEITQVTDNFRSFERGGKVFKGNPSEIGIPNPFEEPGRPDMKTSSRGLGTELRISSGVLNIHKTRLNDPHLSFLGTNDHPGDYRSSGCTGCHVVYANDRSPFNSGPYALYGNRGRSFSADTTISKTESAHPIKHQFTRSIPSSQCMVCHMHQPNAFMNTYFGFQMWDYETDGKRMYPETQKFPSSAEAHATLSKNPEEAVLRGNWSDIEFLADVTSLNPQLGSTQFADYHGHGWIFRAVFKKDRKGNLLDEDGRIIPWNSPNKFEGVVPTYPLVQSTKKDEGQRAVHLKDIHLEKGMHCVDCHFEQDNHGNGKLFGEFHNAIEIQCVDCHGTLTKAATLRTSGLAAPDGGTRLDDLYTPFKQKRFLKRQGTITQRSAVVDTLAWVVDGLDNVHSPGAENYNEKAAVAHLMMKGGGLWKPGMDESGLAHSSEKMECQSCHTSWITNCFGCHLPQQANWRKGMNHFEGEQSRNWTTYNPQVVRDDGFMLGLTGSTKGNKITTVRSSSALMLSSVNANREQIYLQQPPISAAGYSSQAFNPHFAHTVRTTETRQCTDCHVSAKNDNNAWMAQLLLQGTNFVNFMGKYVYVATGDDGLEAVAVTETDEPQAVIGSYLHSLAYPDYYRRHGELNAELQTSYHHGGSVLGSQLRGEYLYAACGEDGFRVYDVANIDNKGYSERIVTAPVSPFGQDTHVPTRFATAVALPTNMPIDTRRVHRPENQEQWPIHPLYSYAYITDKYEGLILVDVMNLVDGEPRNNFLKRAMTFNPNGILDGASNLTIAGNFAYICARQGVVVVSIADPQNPRVVAQVGVPAVVNPKAIAVQFRYAFVCDDEGIKVLDVTFPEKAVPVLDHSLPLAGANDIYVARTYAYVAAGPQGLVIVDVEKPDSIFLEKIFTERGVINDARGVKVASTNASLFAYVADGKNGLRVVQLTSPEDPGHLGFSPKPFPRLIATRQTDGEALSISKGLDRDRAVDESGNQVSIFGRLGSRPFNKAEQEHLYVKDGQVWMVRDDGTVQRRTGGK